MPRGIPNRDAKNSPVISSGIKHSSEYDVGQSAAPRFKESGDNEHNAKVELDPTSTIVVAGEVYSSEKMAMLSFMNEPVTIEIATTKEKNAEQCFGININGKEIFFRRGIRQVIPRYFLDHLLRMKETGYEQEAVENKEGVRGYVEVPRTALKYPVLIIRDDNPRGDEWAQFTIACPG